MMSPTVHRLFTRPPVERLVFPEEATIQLITGSAPDAKPLALAGLVFGVRLRARRKNDYELMPFTSDHQGRVRISTVACEAFVAAEHDSGLMDYAGVEQCSPVVEIRALSGPEVEAALQSRRGLWRQLLRGEDRLFGSLAELLDIYQLAPNARLRSGQPPLIVRWDGSDRRPEYRYAVPSLVPR
jgi:hypothetical protein